MSVSARHLLRQGPNVVGLLKGGVTAFRSRGLKGGAFATPGPLITGHVKAPAQDLIRDYLVWVGGDPKAWAGQVPHHFFPYWNFPWMSKTLEGVPYDVSKILNGGVTLTMNRPIPAGEDLVVTAQLIRIDDDERRVVFHQRVTTSTASAPDAQVAEMRLVLPKKRKKNADGDKVADAPKIVPNDARELARWKLPANAGLDFAVLTGDFNPIHWIPAAGRAAGFGGCILHGFATMARALEGVNAAVLAGRIDAMSQYDVRFARPVKLPGKVGLFVAEPGTFFVGDSVGSPANLIGSYTLRKD
jgi:acyl dehydratase